ncbi:leucine-rich repeat domain-containing protein, partial [Oscillospiraceae bacterium OttesenSCG-928-G22]|nr:leucine-rich repeat domain-containing protein [Oscillospiraceae bacterium OttesenSCG-928-G22]
MKKAGNRLISLALTLALALALVPALTPTARAADVVLEVTFNNNGTGGTSEANNEMKTAIAAALAEAGAPAAADVTHIRLSGSATVISDWNWLYLIVRFNPTWGAPFTDSLTTLDLSGMVGLTTMRNDSGTSYTDNSRLRTVTFPASLTSIGANAFSDCPSLAL